MVWPFSLRGLCCLSLLHAKQKGIYCEQYSPWSIFCNKFRGSTKAGCLMCFTPVRVWSQMGTVTTLHLKLEPLSCNFSLPWNKSNYRACSVAHIPSQMFLRIDCVWSILVLVMDYSNRLPCRRPHKFTELQVLLAFLAPFLRWALGSLNWNWCESRTWTHLLSVGTH